VSDPQYRQCSTDGRKSAVNPFSFCILDLETSSSDSDDSGRSAGEISPVRNLLEVTQRAAADLGPGTSRAGPAAPLNRLAGKESKQ
jgi:hypothetical protein